MFGGAGFIGSRIALACVRAGHRVRIVDGLVPRTSGRRQNLAPVAANVELRPVRIEQVGDLDRVLAESDVIVDCMGWTQHRAALDDPLYDLELNVASHLHWLRRVPDRLPAKIFYLGSRGQYSDPPSGDIGEDDPQDPRDVQGIHKAAAERHFRLAASLRDLDVVSLRLPACIGPNQPTDGDDIGLVGGFARDLLQGRSIVVYGRGRRRAIAYVDDVAEIVCRLAPLRARGFQAYNLRGDVLPIEDLAQRLVRIVGRGAVDVHDLPRDIAAIDSGAAAFREDRLRAALGGAVPRTPVDEALAATVRHLGGAVR